MILVIEDEPNVASAIKRGLGESGFEVSIASNGLTGLQMATDHSFELIILDLMLPLMDGIQICRGIREQNQTVPILMLTALDSTENIVTGLDSGADDYMVKPFKMIELAARIRTLLRRHNGNSSQQQTAHILRISDIQIDTEAKIIMKGEAPLNLTPTEYRLFEYFIKNQRKVLSRLQILENVWDIDFNLGTNVVDVYVNYLRKKIEPKNPNKLIRTVFGMGYMMKESDE